MMADRLQWPKAASLQDGAILLSLDLPPVTMSQLVFYCGAAGVTDPIHYDRDMARDLGFRDLVVNGSLRVGWMAEAVASLVEPPDHVAFFKCSHVRAMHVHEAPRIEVTLTRQESSGAEGDITLTCAMRTLIGDEVADRGEAKIVLVRDGLGTAGGAYSSRPAS